VFEKLNAQLPASKAEVTPQISAKAMVNCSGNKNTLFNFGGRNT
jgi:hypothetical protein